MLLFNITIPPCIILEDTVELTMNIVLCSASLKYNVTYNNNCKCYQKKIKYNFL